MNPSELASLPAPILLLEALVRADCEHLPRLDDLSGAGGAYLPTIESLGEPELATWLEQLGHPPAGAAVTVAVALVRAVAAVHRAGVVGVLPDASAVRFREDGCPVLCAFGALEPLTDAASTRPDWLAVAEVFELLGIGSARGGMLPRAREDRAGSRGRDPVASALASVAAHESPTTLAELEDALFATAPPEPVDLAAGPSIPAALPPTLSTAVRAPAAARGRRLPERLAGAFEAGPHALVAPLLARGRAAAAGRGRLLVVGALIAVVVVVVLLAVVPGDESNEAGTAARRDSAAPTSTVAQPSGTAHSSSAASLAPRTPVQASGAPRSAVPAEVDPVDAATELFAGFTASLIERDGGTALIALQPTAGTTGKPATALLIDGADGWRIRQFFEG